MRRNKSNSEYDSIYPSGLNFFITGDSTKDISNFSDGSIDCISTDLYDKKIFNSANVKLYKTKSSGLFLNPKSEIFESSSLRYALAASFDREQCKKVLPEGFDIAYGIIPNGITMLNKSVRDIVPEADYSLYNVNAAQKAWAGELSKLNVASVDGIKIMVSESFAGSDALHCVTEQWQNNLNFFCSIEVVSEKEYESRVESGDFDIILSECDNVENDPVKCFDYFVSDNMKNILGYSNNTVDSKVLKISKAQSLNESVSAINAAELEIINNAYYIPLFYESKYFLTDKNAQGIEYNPYTGQIYFKKSKMFD
jgi:oligopeptide transport system substrate-binding protein